MQVTRMEIEVQIAPTFARLLSAKRLREVAKGALRCEGVSGQVTLVVTDDEGIQALNREYLGRDAPTDVIVSYPRAVAQAEDHGHSVDEELNLLIVHGVLHLLGYDHADEQEMAVMWARQGAILAGL
jgi:probable rRNA maturation factor